MIQHHVLGRLLSGSFCGAIVCASAYAGSGSVSFNDSKALTSTNWTENLEVPKFDTTLGTLTHVHVELSAQLRSKILYENQDAAPADVQVARGAQVTVLSFDGTPTVLLNSSFSEPPVTVPLAATDGVLDFAGPSGGMTPQLDTTVLDTVDISSAADLAFFKGAGNVSFPAAGQGTSTFAGPGNVTFQIITSAGATLAVTYTYDIIVDCNGNGIDDLIDIQNGTSEDCNKNGIPDECEPDCDGDGIPTACDPCLEPCVDNNRDTPGSLLLFPRFDSRTGRVTVITVTNTNCDTQTGTIDVEYVYIGKYGPGDVVLNCLEFNRTHRLTPCDTLTVVSRSHNASQARGFLYVFAKDRFTGQAVVFNHLIGQALYFTGDTFGDGTKDALNARTFLGIGAEGTPTDVDNDHIRDLDGVEYSEAPDQILIPRFLGQDSGAGAVFRSRLVLIGLSGGADFTTLVDFLVYNDNEEQFSTQYSFRCWDEVRLSDIDDVFLESFLDGTANDPLEIVGQTTKETGWFRLDGNVAFSSADQIVDPAIYAVLFERFSTFEVCDLPWELCTQSNGDLFPRGIFGDNND